MERNKVILISVDGLRPDGFLACGNPYIHELMQKAYYTLDGKTVMPSVTLPCHMSLFHSVDPQRHGISTNLYMPMVRPIDGLFERLKSIGAVSAMYYGWEPLRDVARPESLKFAEFIHAYTEESTDTTLTDRALARIEKSKPDFVFLYMVDTDEKGGHDNVWMSGEYLRRVSIAVDNIRRVIESFGDEYTVVITADHGGHDRTHGTDLPEDTTIPMFYVGKDFPAGQRFSGGSILDIAPTVAKLMGALPAPEWEGRSLI
ncbi:MAG: alkaline phosphatase family protein [Clostridia bacterium]|nr:alkaline phosphatase family protein [Clostridia bacterium]